MNKKNRFYGVLILVLGIVFWIGGYFYFNKQYGLEIDFLIQSWVSVWSVILMSDLIIGFAKVKGLAKKVLTLVIFFIVILLIGLMLSIVLRLSTAIISGILLGAIFTVYIEFGRKLLMGRKIE
jgi:hypothetical protein